MMLEAGDAAMAFRSGNDWVLRPVCPVDGGQENGVVVRTDGGWVLSAAHKPGDDDANGFTVRTAAEQILLSPGCPQENEEPPEFVADPLCAQCNTNVYALKPQYMVSVSGFPSVCTAQMFNGVWTVAWELDCSWCCDITAWHRITLSRDSGGLWALSWRVASSTGISGSFTGDAPASCDPTAQGYVYELCVNSFLCTSVCAAAMADVIVTVADV